MDLQKYINMSKEDKDAHYTRFIKHSLADKPPKQMIQATKGEFQMPKVAHRAKKPGSCRKRAVNQKTKPRY